jgi:hypothetical protein
MLRYPKLLPVAVLALATAVPFSYGQDVGSHARIVRISYLEGSVQLSGAPANMNSPITESTVLATSSDGLAEVQFEDGAMIRLASETQITFTQLARLTSGEAITRVDMDQGEAEFLIPSSSAGLFAVNAGSKNVMFAQPGRFRILSTNASPLEVAVHKGEVTLTDRQTGTQVSVKKNETFTLNPNDPGQYDLESSVVADDLDQWSAERDQTLASINTYSAPSVYNNTYVSNGGSYFPSYGYNGFYGFNGFGCPYGFAGYNYFSPFWFSSPVSSCWNSGFFFWPPGSFFGGVPVVIVPSPVRRPPRHIVPPTVPTVARGEPGSPTGPVTSLRGVPRTPGAPTRPEVRTFRFDGAGQRVFTEDTFQRSVPVERPVDPGKPGANGQTAQGTSNELQRDPSRPVLIMPGQRSAGNMGNTGGNGPIVQPAHASAPPSGSQHTPAAPQHFSAPAAPSRPPSPPPSSGSHGFSGGSSMHSSAPSMSHSGGGSSGRH